MALDAPVGRANAVPGLDYCFYADAVTGKRREETGSELLTYGLAGKVASGKLP